jgi:NADPH2:quinone reductase
VGGEFAEPRSTSPGAAATCRRLCVRPIPPALSTCDQLFRRPSSACSGDFAKREPANAAMMYELGSLYGQGKIKPVIDRTMPDGWPS